MRTSNFIVKVFPIVFAIISAAAQSSICDEVESVLSMETSVDKIERAYLKGGIDYQTALNYKIYAILEPEKLPEIYRSEVKIKCGTPIMQEALQHQQLLFPDNRKILLRPREYREYNGDRLLRPPGPENSGHDDYYGAGIDVWTYNTLGGHFKIWYTEDNTNGDAVPGSDGNQATIPQYVIDFGSYLEHVWTEEVTTMGYEAPASDAGEPNNGGDGLFDVYIVDMVSYGYVSHYCDDPVSYMVVENDYSGFPGNDDPEGNQKGAMKVTAAHEFNHACQSVYRPDCDADLLWFQEATSTCMEELVYPAVNDYHMYLSSWFNAPETSLDDPAGTHEYGSAIFNIYLTQRFGNDILESVWDRIQAAQPKPAIDVELQSRGFSLAEIFPEFAAKNYNKAWYNDGSKYPKVKMAASHALSPFNRKVDEQTVHIDHLATNYIKFSPGWTLIRAQTLQIKVKGLDDENRGTRVVVKPFLGAPYELNLTVDPPETEGYVEIDNFGLFRISEVILVLANGSQDDDNLEFKYEASLAKPIIFVIDDTGSMWDEIASVRNTLIAKINELEATGELIRYTLITYKDDVTLDGQTTDPDVIRGWVSALTAIGGGPCPEEGYGALEMATTVAAGGELWWMTDADSHGGWGRILEVVFRLTSAGVRVHSVIMGSCSKLACNDYGAIHASSINEPSQPAISSKALNINSYEAAAYISGASGGLYFGVSSAQVPDAVTIILEEMMRDATLAIFNQTDSDTFTVPVDSTVSEARFSLNSFPTSSLSLRVKTPGGTEIHPGDPGVTYLSAGGSEYYKVAAPTLEIGEWIAEITGSGEYALSSSGKTPITCDYLSQTSVGLGGPFTLRVSLQGDVENLTFHMVKDNGEPFEELTLFDDGAHDDLDAGDGIYANTYTPTALGTYRVKASGNSFVSRQDPAKIVIGTVNVMAPSDVILYPGDSITHIFTIENLGGTDQTFDLTATSSEGWAELSGVPSQVTIPADSATTVPIPVIVPITALPGSFDQLTLIAVNQTDPLINDVDAVVTYVWTGPVITDLNPSSAPVGASVDIVGENFGEDPGIGNRSTDENNVTLNGERLTDPNIVDWSDTLITFIVPPGATSGPIVVTAGGESSNEFVFIVEVGGVRVNLPDTCTAPGEFVLIPVNVSDLTGLEIYSAQLDLTFDDDVIQATHVSSEGTIAEGWSTPVYNITPGQISIAMAGTEPLAGSGVLVYVGFNVVGSEFDSTTIHFDRMIFNDDLIDDVTDGIFWVCRRFDISGTIRYCLTDEPVDSAKVKCTNVFSDSAFTDSLGMYQLVGLPGGEDYVVKPEKTNDARGSISAFDASLVLRYVVGLLDLSPCQRIAADVTGNCWVNAYDASFILKHVVGLIIQFPVGKDWKFIPDDFPLDTTNWCTAPDSIFYPDLSADQVCQDYTGILYGDLSGNWPSGGALFTDIGEKGVDVAKISIEDIIVKPGEEFVLPVEVKDISNVYSAFMNLTYDANLIEVVKVKTTELTSKYMVVDKVESGRLVLALAGSDPMAGSGSLVDIVFKASDHVSDGATGQITLTDLALDENYIPGLNLSATITVGETRPKEFALSQNYPNPFNPDCEIKYALPTNCQVTLTIYNVLGQKVKVLVDEYQSAGNKLVKWDGKDDQGREVTSGVYFYRIQAGDFVQSKKMVLMK
ncbi:MAG: T9SS type A sorting domain-containing protein [candidate division Zixibacteria bacterium]|nr:T9SS type A sorting domain-containing protein [candidate division Zixibacteria bacterium]